MADGFDVAHGLGSGKDLPIPPELAIVGATAALVVSFTVLIFAWRRPRYDATTSGRPAPGWLAAIVGAAWWLVLWRSLGLVFFAYVGAAAVFGKDLVINPFLGVFYVWVWVGLVPVSLLFGPAWKAISPLRSIHLGFSRLAGSEPARGLFNYPPWLGYWPAALGLYAFVWLELVYPFSTDVGPVRLWVAAYLATMLVGGALFGDRFLEHADPFEVYSTLVARMSIWGRREGQLVVRSPLANLDATPARPGLVGVVAVLFGSTAFDSFRSSSTWIQFVQSGEASPYLLNNLALLVFCAGVGVVLAAGTMLAGVREGQRRVTLPDLFAHSVVPIVIGYVVAHYLSYFSEVGQLTLIQLSDPLSNGSDLLGTGHLEVNYWLSFHPTLLATIKVLAVLIGHVLGVIAAHDRALKVLPEQHQLTGQLPLLVAMVAFTAGGLFLLFAA